MKCNTQYFEWAVFLKDFVNTGDFDAVVRDLADEVDDPRASHLLASAKFQLARQQYRAIADDLFQRLGARLVRH